jgi:hypothetical protein
MIRVAGRAVGVERVVDEEKTKVDEEEETPVEMVKGARAARACMRRRC